MDWSISLLHGKALDVMGLGPGASAAEIKEAYCDLVKVWHPDRFGSDPRLRRKAEEKLQQINNAYRALQSHPEPVRVYSSGSKPGEKSRRGYVRPQAVLNKVGARSKRAVFVWVFGGIGLAVAAVVATLAFNHESLTARPPVIVIPDGQKKESTSAGSDAGASPQKELSVSSSNANQSNHASSPPFRVHPLSDAEAAQLESACGREIQDPKKYQNCVSAQLGTLEPDMSTLSADDRLGIRSACRKTRNSEGLAAYNRCLTRMVKLLSESTQH